MRVLEMLTTIDNKDVLITREENLEHIESSFNSLMYNKYILKSKWVKRVKETNLYNGYREIIFYLDNGCKYKFTLATY